MIRPAVAHARLLLARSYAMAASGWPGVSKNLPLLGHGRSHCLTRQDETKISSRRWCHVSPDNQELAKKSCVPCNSKDIHAMSEDSAKKLLEQVGGWQLATEGDILKLHRVWKVKNFVKGLEFFQLVSAIAEEEGHHPDLHLVGWNNVKIDVWTHSVRGLTDNDFILAAKINNLNLEGLLSKKATSKKDAL
uniref:4a-hydroxytetrahydrobiopterin dehydratase n=1 Tax=Leersia perrieri TaxID=77586 RepID=A0A0D9V3T9_9ORYZ